MDQCDGPMPVFFTFQNISRRVPDKDVFLASYANAATATVRLVAIPYLLHTSF